MSSSVLARWLREIGDEAREVELKAGEVLFREGSESDALFEIVRGEVEVSVGPADAQVPVGTLGPGEILGEISLISGGARTATVTARSRVVARGWDLVALRRHLIEQPELDHALLELTRARIRKETLLRAVTGLVGRLAPEDAQFLVDRATWVDLPRGRTLFRQGDVGEHWFVLVAGRLSVSVAIERSEREVASLDPGRTVGEIAALTGGRRNATVLATRSSSLARFEREDLDVLDAKLPGLVRAMTAGLLRAQFVQTAAPERATCVRVAVVAVRSDPALHSFLEDLAAAGRRVCDTLVVTPESLNREGLLGDAAGTPADHPGWVRVGTWLDEAEQDHQLSLICVRDPTAPMASAVIELADRVLWLADATSAPAPTPQERALMRGARAIEGMQQHLCLLHPPSTDEPRGTRHWLASRPGVKPFHVRAGSDSDSDRVARLVARRPFVLVLGGGGARGLAHLGVARGLRTAGLPIDAVCGTSIGGIIAAQLATGRQHATLMQVNRDAIAARPFQHFTLPWVSIMSMSGFERMAEIAFADRRVEDLWLPYFSTATSLSAKKIVELDEGLVRDIALASAALPGVFPPVCRDGQLLVDGGVLDNLPTERARARWGGVVMAVLLEAEDELGFTGRRVPSGWRLAASRMGIGRAKGPNLGKLLSSTMTLGSYAREQRSTENADVVFRPPVAHIGFTEMHRLSEIERAGFESTHASLNTLTIPGWSP